MKFLYKFGTFYRTIVFWNTGFLLIFVFLVGIPIAQSYLQEKQIRTYEKYEEQLRKMQEKIDIELQTRINMIMSLDFFQKPFYSTLNDFYNPLGNQSASGTMHTNKMAMDFINNIVSQNDILISIFLYRKADDFLISSNIGTVENVSSKHLSLLSNPSIYFHEEAFDQVSANGWITPIQNAHFLPNKPVLSYFQLVPVFSVSKKKDGMIVLNIDVSKLADKIKVDFINETDTLMVVDPSQRIILHTEESASFNPPPQFPGYDYFQKSSFDLTSVKESLSEESNHVIFSKQSKLSFWTYIYSIEKENIRNQIIQSKIITYSILTALTLIGFILSIILSNQAYKPFKRFIEKLVGESAFVDRTNNEFSIIDCVISELNKKADTISTTLKENRLHILYKIGLDLISGVLTDRNEVNHRLETIGMRFEHDIFRISIIRIVSMQAFPYNMREYVRLRISVMVEDYFQGSGTCIAVSDTENTIILILNVESKSNQGNFMDGLLPHIRQELELDYIAAISHESNELSELHELFLEATKLTEKSFFHGYNQVFLPEMEVILPESKYSINEELKMVIIKLLNSGRSSEVSSLIQNLLSDMRSTGNSVHDSRTTLSIIGRLITTEMKRILDSRTHEGGAVILSFTSDDFITIDSFSDKINTLLSIFRVQVATTNKPAQTAYIEKIQQYIISHVDNQLSLTSVASHFGISSNYLSSIFKTYVGMNFSDFIVEAKLLKATHLLVEDRQMTIAKITSFLGYANHSYFDKLFKERFGLSPAQYRKEKSN